MRWAIALSCVLGAMLTSCPKAQSSQVFMEGPFDVVIPSTVYFVGESHVAVFVRTAQSLAWQNMLDKVVQEGYNIHVYTREGVDGAPVGPFSPVMYAVDIKIVPLTPDCSKVEMTSIVRVGEAAHSDMGAAQQTVDGGTDYELQPRPTVWRDLVVEYAKIPCAPL